MITLPVGQMNKYLTVEPQKCLHENGFTNEICNDCGFECDNHEFDSYGQCTCCGYECDHPEFEDGYCIECGKVIHDVVDFEVDYE